MEPGDEMAQNFQVIPPEDEERTEPDLREDPKRSRFTLDLRRMKLEVVGKALEQRGAILGIGLITGSIVVVLILLKDILARLLK